MNEDFSTTAGLAGHGDFELVEQLGNNSLGYLLQRDKEFEEALAETPWLTHMDSNGAVVVRSDSLILEEISDSENETILPHSAQVVVSSSMPVLRKTLSFPVKHSASFSSSGYSSFCSHHSNCTMDTVPPTLHAITSSDEEVLSPGTAVRAIEKLLVNVIKTSPINQGLSSFTIN